MEGKREGYLLYFTVCDTYNSFTQWRALTDNFSPAGIRFLHVLF